MTYVRSWGPYSLASPEGGLTYTDAVGPILAERCGGCHGDSAGLSVGDHQSLMTGADCGPVIVPGSSDESRIVEVLQEGHYAQLSDEALSRLIE